MVLTFVIGESSIYQSTQLHVYLMMQKTAAVMVTRLPYYVASQDEDQVGKLRLWH